mgnify:FL=1
MPLGSQPLVNQDDTIRLSHDCFDPVTPAAAEQEEGMADVHGKLLLYNRTEPINRLAHVGPAADNVNCVHAGEVG